MNKIDLKGLSLEELETFAVSNNEAKFRGRQLFQWIYQKKIQSFDPMSNISMPLRTKFDNVSFIGKLEKKNISSSQSGTIKYLFELADGHLIESVYIPEGSRRTLCVSSQAGCPLACTFCATGKLGYKRNLTAGEIVDQVISVEQDLGIELTNVVFMGMGEPMLNYDNVIKACELISHPDGIAIGKRHIVISTAGWVPGIMRYADEEHRYKLAISLHATTDEDRIKLMPVGKKYSIKDSCKQIFIGIKQPLANPGFYQLLEHFNYLMDTFKCKNWDFVLVNIFKIKIH